MKTGRNDACPCGSGRKYKNCCLDKRASLPAGQRIMLGIIAVVVVTGLLVIFVTVRDHDYSNSGGGIKVWSEEHQHWHYE